MAPRVDLVLDPARGERIPIELPLTLTVPLDAARRELELPDFVDLSDPIVAKAVALLAAARRADPPVRFAVFGGTAHRLQCPASNDRALGLRHELHDLDVAVLLKEARAFQRFLAGLAAREGSQLTFFETSGDRIFNSLSGGARLREHMVVEHHGTEVVLGTLDLVADEFRFCHRFDVRTDVTRAAREGGTLAPVHLFLAKAQFVRRIPQADADRVADRVLEPFGRHELVIGPEAKDVRDLLALLHDHDVGEGPGAISATAIARLLGADWGFWKTVSLNVDLLARSSILAGLPAGPRERIAGRVARLKALLASLRPKRRFGLFGGPWWQEVDSVPATDATVGVS